MFHCGGMGNLHFWMFTPNRKRQLIRWFQLLTTAQVNTEQLINCISGNGIAETLEVAWPEICEDCEPLYVKNVKIPIKP